MMIAARTHPDILTEILASVAHPGDLKHHRKSLMLEAVASRSGLSLEVPGEHLPTYLPTWGAQFADDLSSIYVAKVLGADRVVNAYAGGIPEGALKLIERTDVEFFERFNPHALARAVPHEDAVLASRLISAGLVPYGRSDWHSAELAVQAILARE